MKKIALPLILLICLGYNPIILASCNAAGTIKLPMCNNLAMPNYNCSINSNVSTHSKYTVFLLEPGMANTLITSTNFSQIINECVEAHQCNGTWKMGPQSTTAVCQKG